MDDTSFAFPFTATTGQYTNRGMSLRDYFAARAMHGLIAVEHDASTDSGRRWIAVVAYELADAMLKERAK